MQLLSLQRNTFCTSLVVGAGLAGTLASAVPMRARAQASDTLAARELSAGVGYRHFVDKTGPWNVHLVRVDLRRADIEVRPARARDQLKGRERVSDMARRAAVGGVRVLAGVNGDFFELKSGENENNQVIAGEWWKGLMVTDSPYDTYDNTHVQLGIDGAGRPVMDRFELEGKVWDHDVATPILAVNFNPSGKPEGTALYTSRFGAAAPHDTTRATVEAALVPAGRRGDTLLFVRRGPVATVSGSPIPTDGAVMAAYGAGLRQKEVQALAEGDTVKVLLATLPHAGARAAAPRMLIGGWPRILRDGANVAGESATTEGTISRNAEMRHPRTAVGFSRDSTTLFILTVDGRSENSGGMTLGELATMMQKLGAWQAMNFDGGGSTTMVIDGALVNSPSDATGEREVGNALLVVKKP
jgi:hypothetical protein